MEEKPRPLRLGVIGAGWFASRRHCPDVVDHPEVELAALCRRDEKQLAQMARAFDVADTYTDYAGLIASGSLDGVIICSPHQLHFEHTRAALEAGLHVLLEKPITLDPDEGRQLVALSAATGRALVVAQNPPYWSHCRFLRNRLRHGDLGEIEGVSINWVGNALGVLGLEPLPDSLPGVVKPTLFRGDAAQNGGGFLIDGGSHLLCELLWCTGLRVVEVSAHMDNPDWDLRAALPLTLENGALATLSNTADSAVRDKRHHSLYYGSAGTAVIRGFPFEVTVDAGGRTEHVVEAQLPPPPTPVDNLVDCARGRGLPELDGETAVHIIEILDAAYCSARGGHKVSL